MSSGSARDDNADYVSPYEWVFIGAAITRREEGAYKLQQKKMNHNEAEKKRIKTINKCVDDIRDLLDVSEAVMLVSLECKSATQVGQGFYAGGRVYLHQDADARTRSSGDDAGMLVLSLTVIRRHRNNEFLGFLSLPTGGIVSSGRGCGPAHSRPPLLF